MASLLFAVAVFIATAAAAQLFNVGVNADVKTEELNPQQWNSNLTMDEDEIEVRSGFGQGLNKEQKKALEMFWERVDDPCKHGPKLWEHKKRANWTEKCNMSCPNDYNDSECSGTIWQCLCIHTLHGHPNKVPLQDAWNKVAQNLDHIHEAKEFMAALHKAQKSSTF